MMPPLPILQPEPPRQFGQYLRTGYCCRCGDCCKGNPFTGETSGYCPLYREAEGLGECSDRTSAYYQGGCIDWPQKPEHLIPYPDCTYRFELTA
jgi:hypothetical protein